MQNEALLNRDIDFCNGKDVINTFKIVKIVSVGKQMVPWLNKISESYVCTLHWGKAMPEAQPEQLFPQEVFDDLLAKGVSLFPGMPNLFYAFRDESLQKKPAVSRKDDYKKLNAKIIPEWHKQADEKGMFVFMMLTMNENNEIGICTSDGISNAEIVGRLRHLAKMIESSL